MSLEICIRDFHTEGASALDGEILGDLSRNVTTNIAHRYVGSRELPSIQKVIPIDYPTVVVGSNMEIMSYGMGSINEVDETVLDDGTYSMEYSVIQESDFFSDEHKIGRVWKVANHTNYRFRSAATWGDQAIALQPAVAAAGATIVDKNVAAASQAINELFPMMAQTKIVLGQLHRNRLSTLLSAPYNAIRVVYRLATLYHMKKYAEVVGTRAVMRTYVPHEHVVPIGESNHWLGALMENGVQWLYCDVQEPEAVDTVVSVLGVCAMEQPEFALEDNRPLPTILTHWPTVGYAKVIVPADAVREKDLYNSLSAAQVWDVACAYASYNASMQDLVEVTQFLAANMFSPDGYNAITAYKEVSIALPVARLTGGVLMLISQKVVSWGEKATYCDPPPYTEMISNGVHFAALVNLGVRQVMRDRLFNIPIKQSEGRWTNSLNLMHGSKGCTKAIILAQHFLNKISIPVTVGRYVNKMSWAGMNPDAMRSWYNYQNALQWEEVLPVIPKVPCNAVIMGMIDPVRLETKNLRLGRFNTALALPGAFTVTEGMSSMSIHEGIQFAHRITVPAYEQVKYFEFNPPYNYSGSRVSDWVFYENAVVGDMTSKIVFRIRDRSTMEKLRVGDLWSARSRWYIETTSVDHHVGEFGGLDDEPPPPFMMEGGGSGYEDHGHSGFDERDYIVGVAGPGMGSAPSWTKDTISRRPLSDAAPHTETKSDLLTEAHEETKTAGTHCGDLDIIMSDDVSAKSMVAKEAALERTGALITTVPGLTDGRAKMLHAVGGGLPEDSKMRRIMYAAADAVEYKATDNPPNSIGDKNPEFLPNVLSAMNSLSWYDEMMKIDKHLRPNVAKAMEKALLTLLPVARTPAHQHLLVREASRFSCRYNALKVNPALTVDEGIFPEKSLMMEVARKLKSAEHWSRYHEMEIQHTALEARMRSKGYFMLDVKSDDREKQIRRELFKLRKQFGFENLPLGLKQPEIFLREHVTRSQIVDAVDAGISVADVISIHSKRRKNISSADREAEAAALMAKMQRQARAQELDSLAALFDTLVATGEATYNDDLYDMLALQDEDKDLVPEAFMLHYPEKFVDQLEALRKKRGEAKPAGKTAAQLFAESPEGKLEALAKAPVPDTWENIESGGELPITAPKMVKLPIIKGDDTRSELLDKHDELEAQRSKWALYGTEKLTTAEREYYKQLIDRLAGLDERLNELDAADLEPENTPEELATDVESEKHLVYPDLPPNTTPKDVRDSATAAVNIAVPPPATLNFGVDGSGTGTSVSARSRTYSGEVTEEEERAFMSLGPISGMAATGRMIKMKRPIPKTPEEWAAYDAERGRKL